MAKHESDALDVVVGASAAISGVCDSKIKDFIPFVGVALDAVKQVNAFRERAFTRKLAGFISTFEGLSEEQLERLRFAAAGSKDELGSFGEQVVLAIEQSFDYDKPGLYAKLFLAYADKVIDREQFGRFALAVDKTHTADLVAFIKLVEGNAAQWWLKPALGIALEPVAFARGNSLGMDSEKYMVSGIGRLFHRAMQHANAVLAKARGFSSS